MVNTRNLTIKKSLFSILYLFSTTVYGSFISLIDTANQLRYEVADNHCIIRTRDGEQPNYSFTAITLCASSHLAGLFRTWHKSDTKTEDGIDYFKLSFVESNAKNTINDDYYIFSPPQETKLSLTTLKGSAAWLFLDDYNRLAFKKTAKEMKRNSPLKCVYVEENNLLLDKQEFRSVKVKRCEEYVHYNKIDNEVFQLITGHSSRNVNYDLETKGNKQVSVGAKANDNDAAGFGHVWKFTEDNKIQVSSFDDSVNNKCLTMKVKGQKIKNKMVLKPCEDAISFVVDDGSIQIDGYDADADLEIHPVHPDTGSIMFSHCLMTVEREGNTKLLVSPCRRRVGLFDEFKFKGDPNEA